MLTIRNQSLFAFDALEYKAKSPKKSSSTRNPTAVLLPIDFCSTHGLIDIDYIIYSYENKFRSGDEGKKNLPMLTFAPAYYKALSITCSGKLDKQLPIDKKLLDQDIKSNQQKLDSIFNKYQAVQYRKDAILQSFINRLRRNRSLIAHDAAVTSQRVKEMQQMIEKYNLQSIFAINMQQQMQAQINKIMKTHEAEGLNIIGPGTDPNFALYGTTYDNSKFSAIEAILEISKRMPGIHLIGICGTEQAVGFLKGLSVGLARGDKTAEKLVILDYKQMPNVSHYEKDTEKLAQLHKLHGKDHDISLIEENKSKGTLLTIPLPEEKPSNHIKQKLSCEHGLTLWAEKQPKESDIYATNGRFKPGFHPIGETLAHPAFDKVHTIIAQRVKDQKIANKWNHSYSVQKVDPKNMIHLIVGVDENHKLRELLFQHHPEESYEQLENVVKLLEDYNNTPSLSAADFLKSLTQVVNNSFAKKAQQNRQ